MSIHECLEPCTAELGQLPTLSLLTRPSHFSYGLKVILKVRKDQGELDTVPSSFDTVCFPFLHFFQRGERSSVGQKSSGVNRLPLKDFECEARPNGAYEQ